MGRLLRRIGHLLRWRRAEQDLQDEMAFHRELLEQRSPGVAGRAMGNVTLAREDARAVWVAPWLDALQQDLRYAVRSLLRQRSFTVMTLLTLGVAMGLNTTLYTGFSGMFLQQWHVDDPAHVVEVLKRSGGRNVESDFTQRAYERLAGDARLLSLMATGCGGGAAGCRMDAGGETINGQFVSANFFQVLGARMALGRGFHRDEDLPHVAAVAVISERFWRRNLAADPTVIDGTLRLDGIPFTVVGIVHDSFVGPSLIRRDVWVPLGASRLLRPSDAPELTELRLAGRLAPGATAAQASAELDALFARDQAPTTATGRERARIVLTPTTYFADHHEREEAMTGFGIVAIGVVLVLLLACANAGNLLLARTMGRRRELSVRSAIGADRSRLLRQLLTESLLLSTIAAAIGLWVATWLPTLLLNAIFATTDSAGPIHLSMKPDASVLAATAGLIVLTCVGFGLPPALYASRPDVSTMLKGRVAGEGGRMPLRSILLGLQVALSIVLLMSALLLIRAIGVAKGRDVGFKVDGIAVVNLRAPRTVPPAQVRKIADGFIESFRDFPDQDRFALASLSPFTGGSGMRVGLPGERDAVTHRAGHLEISPSYFDVLGIAVLAGRTLAAGDGAAGRVVVNRALADRLWPGRNPVAEALAANRSGQTFTLEVVGVVADADTEGTARRMQAVLPKVYFLIEPGGQTPRLAPVPAILTRADAAAAQSTIAALASRLDSRVTVRARPLADSLDAAFDDSRIAASAAAVLGVSALVLASVGVFGVFAFSVRQHERDIGVRIALGAAGSRIVRDLMALASRPLVAGLVAGVAGAAVGGSVLRNALYGLSPTDPATYGLVIAIVTAAAAVAVAIPAWRATRVDPVIALRSE